MNREEMLDSCKETILKHRQVEYGTPENNFSDIAEMWTTYLHRKHGLVAKLEGHDVAAMMVCLKVMRSITSPKQTDTWVDIAGYAACGCEIATEKKPASSSKALDGARFSIKEKEYEHEWCEGLLTQCIHCGEMKKSEGPQARCDPFRLAGKTEYCCDCGNEYPRSDLIRGWIYCAICRQKPENKKTGPKKEKTDVS